MRDGWETKRSRNPGHHDWVIILLFVKQIFYLTNTHTRLRGCAGVLDHVEIDTNHFMGNFPESVEIFATNSKEVRVL
jgi:allantoicase